MLSDQVELNFGHETRNRGSAFAVKRSRTKRSFCKTSLIANDKEMTLNKNKLFAQKMKYQVPKRKEKTRSDRTRKKLKLIEDYFYPEGSKACIDPTEHEPDIQSEPSGELASRKHQPRRPTLNYLEGSQALKEVQDCNSGTLLHCSIIQTIKKIIKIDSSEVSNFENWDKDTNVPYKEKIIDDIKRSRIRDCEDKESILDDLLVVIIFYCENNTIVYQQGMQDIFIPFIYLKSNEFKLSEVYAYSKGYIDTTMPNTLHSKFNGKDYSLPHLQ